MRALWTIGAVVTAGTLAVSCSPSSTGGDSATTPTPTPTATGTPPQNTGDHITSDTSWTGAVVLANNTTVDAGVTVTADDGATISVAPGAKIYVQGTLVVNGTAGGGVTFNSSSPGTAWAGLEVQQGGLATVHYATIQEASVGVAIDSGALLSKFIGLTLDADSTPINAADSVKFCRMSLANGSGLSNFTGGTITLVDSSFDAGPAGYDATHTSGSAQIVMDHSHMGTNWHCLLHGGGGTTSMTVTKSVLELAHWPFMLTGSGFTVSGSRIVRVQGTGDYGIESGNATINAQGNYWGPDFESACPAAGTDVPATVDASACVMSATDSAVVDAGPRAGAGCEADSSF